jgi:urease beta subunit
MKPGEIINKKGFIELNKTSNSITIKVSNKGDRPIQVGSHYHFEEVNEFLEFDRLK